MKTKPDSLCAQCGAVLAARNQKTAAPIPTASKDPDREYDHRGVLLPRRTRVGGIITPQ
ncbi:MAG TPA: hypothetical protein VHX63_03265 [Acidobacteriaceae bacterium]|nr:hypothetical protein [Acidobacteriaceae bacterium]